jgi:uncharacterized protein
VSSSSASGTAGGPEPHPSATARPPAALQRIVASIAELADDASVPRNVRRGAQSAIDELAKRQVALDVRVAGAVYVLDDLANDPNLPIHGRTAIWSIISSLESLP